MVDEQDVPVVVRTLFKAARERDSAVVVSRVRSECAGLGITALAILVDVLADSFSFNEVHEHADLALARAAHCCGESSVGPGSALEAGCPKGGRSPSGGT